VHLNLAKSVLLIDRFSHSNGKSLEATVTSISTG